MAGTSGWGETSHSKCRNAARRIAGQIPLLELEGTAGPVSTRIRTAEAGAPPEKRMRRIRSDTARIRFTGLDGPVGARMPASCAYELRRSTLGTYGLKEKETSTSMHLRVADTQRIFHANRRS